MRKKESIKPAMIELFKAEALSLMGTTNEIGRAHV